MRRSARFHWLLATLFIGVVLALGWFNERFGVEFDATANNRHSLSEESVAALEALDEQVSLLAVIGPDPVARSALSKLVARFQDVKPDLTLEFINPDTDPARVRDLGAEASGELIVRSADREQRLNVVSERSLVGAFRQLGRDGVRQIAFTTGHDERSPLATTNDDFGVVGERLNNIGYAVQEISLVSKPVIGDEVDVLVLAAPRRPFFPGEVASVKDYLDRGGSLLWLVETPTDGETGPGLELIADELGIETLPGVVIDTASQSVVADDPDFVVLDRFPDHPITRSLTSPVLLPQARALSAIALAGQEIQALLQTAESSWTETGKVDPTTGGTLQFDAGTEEVAGPLVLGLTIERLLGPGTGSAGNNSSDNSHSMSQTNRQRIAVIGDADFATSRFVGNGSNLALTESLMLWLAGDADDLAFVTQPAPDGNLQLGRQAIITYTAVLLAGLPLVLLIFALVVFLVRRRSNRPSS